VWRIRLDQVRVPPATAGEAARAARFHAPVYAARYLAAHGALRAILARYTKVRLDFALREKGKPYLPMAPEVRFNLSHSHEMALVAVSLGVEVGVDVERLRPMPQFAAIAERFFPPSAERPAGEADFFRSWTRVEAVLKARGVGLYSSSSDPEGKWSVEEIDAGPGFAAAVAAEGTEIAVKMHDYQGDA
jgi:4'-phosphopantetheinyl transferase